MKIEFIRNGLYQIGFNTGRNYYVYIENESQYKRFVKSINSFNNSTGKTNSNEIITKVVVIKKGLTSIKEFERAIS